MPANLFFHNPRCRKSREALSLLQEKGVSFQIIEYLKNPPDAEQIAYILEKLGMQALELMRTQESVFKDLHLTKKDERPVSEWIEIMAANPILIERPVLIYNGKVALGRPPQNILSIL